MGKTPGWTMWTMVLCTILLSTGQVLLKLGAKKTGVALFLEPLVIAGFFLLCCAGVLMTLALKHGELSVLYPVIALGFVWVIIASIIILDEMPPVHRVLGIISVVAGVSIIGHKGRLR